MARLSSSSRSSTLNTAREFSLRPATLSDRDDLGALIAHSARALSRGYYEQAQVAAALRGAFGVDTSLIADGTYFVAETSEILIGCGGWSRRKTMFGGDHFSDRSAALLDPQSDAARIRAFFVHPDWARQGVGRAILERCEMEAGSAGFQSFALMATLPGVPFYRACGYRGSAPAFHKLAPGVEIEFLPMEKCLTIGILSEAKDDVSESGILLCLTSARHHAGAAAAVASIRSSAGSRTSRW